MAKASTSKRRQKGGDEAAVRKRILEAALAAFMKRRARAFRSESFTRWLATNRKC
jgi:hypothetical protein